MSASIYADSSFIVSLVCKDTRTDEATAFMERAAAPLIFTHLHRIETRNAIRNAAAREAITQPDQRAAFRQIEDDLRDGLLVHSPVNWTDTFRRADELSEKPATRSTPARGLRGTSSHRVMFHLRRGGVSVVMGCYGP